MRTARLHLLSLLGLCCLSGAASAVTYNYAGPNFENASGAFDTTMSISGQFTVATQLSPFLPSTDISAQVTSYSFDDGVKTLNSANSKILDFFVTTGTAGNVIGWGIAVWRTPITTMIGGSVAGINLNGTFIQDHSFTDAPCSQTGGPGGECDQLIDLTGGTDYAFSSSLRGRWSCDDCVTIAVPQGRAWPEAGDAPSFPDGSAQVIRGQGPLTAITGATDQAGGDLRDAYCVRIPDPISFLATTHPGTDPGAGSDFDTRLFLFRPDGALRLANEDTLSLPGSTLTWLATDGLGFGLDQPGEYLLVVGDAPDEPLDAAEVGLFDTQSARNLVLGPNPPAGRFDHWQNGAPATGTYTVILFGAEPCQRDLDAVFANLRQDLGFINADPHLDAAFAFGGKHRDRVCLGNGAGGFTCSDVSSDLINAQGVALGFVNGDQALDAVFARVGGSAANRVCLGDGAGGFSCDELDAVSLDSRGVALGEVTPKLIFGDGFESGDASPF